MSNEARQQLARSMSQDQLVDAYDRAMEDRGQLADLMGDAQRERDALRADLATAAEVTARLTEERDILKAQLQNADDVYDTEVPRLISERDALRAQRDAAVEALEALVAVEDNYVPESPISMFRTEFGMGRAALLLARGTP